MFKSASLARKKRYEFFNEAVHKVMYTRLHLYACLTTPATDGDLGGLLLDLDQGITELLVWIDMAQKV